jgi:hypothetical protein
LGGILGSVGYETATQFKMRKTGTPVKIMFAVATILLSTTTANALQLSCKLTSAGRLAELLETLKITVATGGGVTFWHKLEHTSYREEEEKFEEVLFHSMTSYDGTPDGSRFSVLVTESRFLDQTFPPTVYFIDWGKAELAQITAVARKMPGGVVDQKIPLAQIYFRYKCERLD